MSHILRRVFRIHFFRYETVFYYLINILFFMTKICLYFKAILHFVLLADNIDIAYMVILLLSKRPLLV